MKKILTTVGLILFYCLPQAEAVLLGELPFNSAGSYSFRKLADIDAHGMYLGYGLQPISYPNPFETYIGMTVPIDEAITTYDFNSQNSPYFAEVTSRITDGESEIIRYVATFDDYADNPIRVIGGTGWNDTSDLNSSSQWQIDYIRLSLDTYVLGPSPLTGDEGFSYQSKGKWEIWGSTADNPPPNKPTPPTQPVSPKPPLSPIQPTAPTPPNLSLGSLFEQTRPNSPIEPTSPFAPTAPNSVFAATSLDSEIQQTTNPEPATLLLFAMGMSGAALSHRKRR